MKNVLHLCLLFASLLLLTACQENTKVQQDTTTETESHLGDINFQVSGSKAAQPSFEKGMLLLHSFEYEDAREAFLEAQEIDSSFAMAYWGEAMTFNHSLWQKQEKEKARTALNKLGATKEQRATMIQTDLEKDFFKSIEILYGEGTKYDRDIAYKNFMEKLTKKYPEHNEVSAFYAVSLLGASRNGRDSELYEKSAQIAQSIIKENPQHPGALHYLIHSYDDPVHAHLAKFAADSYSKTAPDAAHALHMPSHIYMALGKWNDVVTSNIASWNASVKRKQRKELDNDALNYHAFNWLQYGLLQRGEVALAEKLFLDMVKYSSENMSTKAKSYLLTMKGAQMIESGNWSPEIANIEIDPQDLNIISRSQHAFIEGMKAYNAKDEKELDSWIASIKADRKAASFDLGNEGFAMCSAAGYANKPPSQLDIDMAQVMEMELSAYLAILQGQKKSANKYFAEACKLEETLSYSFGPPEVMKPVQEAYAEWLLEEGKASLALEVFDRALKRQPRRLLSLRGKKKAAELINNNGALAEVRQELAISQEKKERKKIL